MGTAKPLGLGCCSAAGQITAPCVCCVGNLLLAFPPQRAEGDSGSGQMSREREAGAPQAPAPQACSRGAAPLSPEARLLLLQGTQAPTAWPHPGRLTPASPH